MRMPKKKENNNNKKRKFLIQIPTIQNQFKH